MIGIWPRCPLSLATNLVQLTNATYDVSEAELLDELDGGMMGWASLPLEIQFPIGRCTVSQVEIDEALIRNAHTLRNRFEIVDALFVQTDRDLFLEL